MAQELLFAYQPSIGLVELEPSSGGAFEISVNGQVVYSRLQSGVFPDLAEVKSLVQPFLPPQEQPGE